MECKKLIYRNFFGEYNILITISCNGKTPHDMLVPSREIHHSHIWIHDNIVMKNHTGKEVFILGNKVSDEELKEVFGNTI